MFGFTESIHVICPQNNSHIDKYIYIYVYYLQLCWFWSGAQMLMKVYGFEDPNKNYILPETNVKPRSAPDRKWFLVALSGPIRLGTRKAPSKLPADPLDEDPETPSGSAPLVCNAKDPEGFVSLSIECI